MQLKFYGGAQEVGRSAILLKDDRSILLDYGVKIDHKTEYPKSVVPDLMILSHAHLDHSGHAPALYEDATIPTFGTEPTLAFSNLLLKDTLNIAKKQHTPAGFHRKQLERFMKGYTKLDYKKPAHFGKYDIELFDAGHISGSAITLIERPMAKKHKRIVYTGDFKLDKQLLHNGADIVKSDVLIIESTYAYREHPDRSDTIDSMVEEIQSVIDNGGTALLPCFAVGRSQELITMLHRAGLSQYVYLDGMAKDATSIALHYPNYIANAELLSDAAGSIKFVQDQYDREDALNGPSIVVTTSGMLNGGPVMEYITKLNKNSHIFLTGYQQEDTNGRLLLETGNIGINGARRKIQTPVSFHDFSAHAGMSDLFKYVKESAPEVVVCVHGSEDNAKRFAESLKLEGYEAHAPKIGDTINLED
ncbi:MAG: MBL fold metallo-hydrolase [Candidatus Marsarchaeota archaeon]|nr:MBL fold metallo-hydrolase [Candidatus Marsarchaeota archaeon]